MSLTSTSTPSGLAAIHYENLTPPIPDSLKDAIKDSIQHMIKLEDKLDNLRGMLKTPAHNSQWNSTHQIARSLRYQLNLRSRWLLVKNLFTNAVKSIDTLHNKFDQEFKPANYRKISRGSHYWRRHRPADTVTASDFSTHYLHPAHYTAMFQLNQHWTKLLSDSSMLYQQSELLLALPAWNKALKKICPVGGREAYSLLLVAKHGWSHKTLSPQNKLFGWFETGDTDSSQGRYTYANLKLAIQRLRQSERMAAKVTGLAPSFETGCREFNKYNSPPSPAPTSYSGRLGDLMYQYNARTIDDSAPNQHAEFASKRVMNVALLHPGSASNYTAGMLKLCRYPQWSELLPDKSFGAKGRKVASAVIRKIMAPNDAEFRLNSNVETILVGPVVRASGDDYYAQCVFTRASNNRSGEPYQARRYYTQKGWVLFRRNWPDMYHMDCRSEVIDGIVPDDINTATTLVRRTAERSWDHPPTHAEIAAQLDVSSREHFNRMKDEVERQLSAKQRKAKILRRLRALPLLTRDDSYKSGNCVSGTEAFINTLQSKAGLTITDKIDGRVLAKGWYKTNYPQLDNLSRVATYLTDKVEAMKMERALAGNPEVVVHTQYAADYDAMLQSMARPVQEIVTRTITLSDGLTFAMPVLTEGEFDAMQLTTAGIPAITATLE